MCLFFTFLELKSYSPVAHHTPQPQPQTQQGAAHTTRETVHASPSSTPQSQAAQGSPAPQQHYTAYTSASYSYSTASGKILYQ